MSSQKNTARDQGHHGSNAPTGGGGNLGHDPQSKETEEVKHVVTLDVPLREHTEEADQNILADQLTRGRKIGSREHTRSTGSRSSSTSTSTKSSESKRTERELRRVRRGTATVEEIMHLREQSISVISAEDPDKLSREARKASLNIDVEPPLIVPRDTTRHPPPQSQVNLTRTDRQKIQNEFPGATILYSYPFIVVGDGTAPKNPVSAKGLIF